MTRRTIGMAAWLPLPLLLAAWTPGPRSQAAAPDGVSSRGISSGPSPIGMPRAARITSRSPASSSSSTAAIGKPVAATSSSRISSYACSEERARAPISQMRRSVVIS